MTSMAQERDDEAYRSMHHSVTLTDDAATRWRPADDLEARSPARWTAARRAGWIVLGLQLVVLLVITGRVWHSFNLGQDFAMFHQAWFGIAHGNLDPQTTFIRLSFWRDQSAFIVWLLAPFYYLYPHAITLLWIQALALVGAELVAYLWVIEVLERRTQRQRLKRWLVPSVALVLILANPWIYLIIVTDFHVETLATLFLVLAGRELWHRHWTRAWIWAGACLLTGTVGGLSVICLGLAAVVAGRSTMRRQGLALAALGFAWIGLIVSLPADYGGGANAYAYLKSPGSPTAGVAGIVALVTGLLGHPGRAFHMIGTRTQLLYENFASFGYVGVLWPWAGIVIVLLTLVYVLNVNPAFIIPGFQNFTTYVLGAVGCGFVLGRIIEWRRGRLIALLLAGALVANAVTFSFHRLPHVPCGNTSCSLPAPPVSAEAASQLSSVLKRTPTDAEVVSSLAVAGRFAGRRFIYPLAFANSGVVGSPPNSTLPVNARTIVFVFTPYQGIEPVNVLPAIPYVRDQLHAQVLTERADVYAYVWNPAPGLESFTLPIPP